MSYTNRVQAYNAKMRVFGAEQTSAQNITQNDSTVNSADEQFVSFAFYESVTDAKKDNYPGGLAFAHDATLNSGVIFKEGVIVSSKVLDVKVVSETLPDELKTSTTAKAERVSISYVDDNGAVAVAEFSTINQNFVKEIVSVMSADNELANSIDNFLKKTDNVSANCEEIENLFDVKTNANESGFISYEISFNYAKLSEKIASEFEARFANIETKNVELENAIEQITNEIADFSSDSSTMDGRLSAIEEGYVKNIAVLTAVEESSLTDTVQVSISQMGGSSSDVQFEVPSDEFYQEYNNLKENVSLIESTVGGLETGVQEMTQSIESLNQKLDSSVAEVYSKIEEESERIESSVIGHVDELTNSIGDLKSDLNDVSNKVSALETNKTELDVQISEIKDSLEKLDEDMDASFGELVNKIDTQKDEIDEHINQVSESVIDVSTNVDTFIEEVSERIDLNAENIQNTNTQLNDFKAEIQEKFNNAIIDIEDLMKKINAE